MSESTTPLYGPTGKVVAEMVVPPFPLDPARTVCPCGGIGTTHTKADLIAPESDGGPGVRSHRTDGGGNDG